MRVVFKRNTTANGEGRLISQRNSSGSLKKILYHYNFIHLWTSGITTTTILARLLLVQ